MLKPTDFLKKTTSPPAIQREASPIPLRWEGANQQPIIHAVSPPFPFGEGRGEASTWRAGREVDYYHEKGNLENNYSVGHLCFDRSSNHAWCDKLHSALISALR